MSIVPKTKLVIDPSVSRSKASHLSFHQENRNWVPIGRRMLGSYDGHIIFRAKHEVEKEGFLEGLHIHEVDGLEWLKDNKTIEMLKRRLTYCNSILSDESPESQNE